MALFQVEQNKVKVVKSKEFDDEAALQRLFDANLEDVTGVRLIESQYSIPNGRIDSLGIDEQATPVVIEYKWGYDPGAIIQGLFYLRWVKENRRTFEMLVREKFGNLKVNWTSAPRLLIVAKQFSDKEVSAIDLVSVAVELKRYSFYGNLLSLEDVTPLKPLAVERVGKTVVRVEGAKSIDDLVKRTPSSLKNLFFDLRNSILGLGDDVREKVGGWYCDYRKSSTFVEVIPQSRNNRLMVYIKMGDRVVNDPKTLTASIPSSWGYGKLNTQFAVTDKSQLDYAMQLIRQAYDYVP
jgi:predicted transport protein